MSADAIGHPNAPDIDEIAKFYRASGTVFAIDCHKRSTAHIIESRFEMDRAIEASVWDGHYVAALAANDEAAEEIRETVPEMEIVAEKEVE